MPSMYRRGLLAAAGALTVGSLAGCEFPAGQSVPAGSLRFENKHNLPHSLRVEVTGVGDATGDEPGEVTGDVIAPPSQGRLTASGTVDPAESETYDSDFTEPVWYAIQFGLDGGILPDNSGTTVFNPAQAAGGTWEFVTGRVDESGEFSWVVSTTENPGQFES
jgi:hypothetical protein